jgi:hypothetical protein
MKSKIKGKDEQPMKTYMDPKDKYMHKMKHDHMETYIEHVCNSGMTL